MKYAALIDNEKFEIREGELRVKRNPIIKVTHVGVCGTDLGQWKEGAHHKELVIGHEYSGIIVEPGTTGLFKEGDRVAGYTQNVFNEPCGHCENCLNEDFDNCTNRKVYTWKGGDYTHPGAYSQYTTWFPKSIYKLPDGIELDEAALIEPFTVGLHAVLLTEMKPDDKVLVLGGGIIGLAVSEWLKVYGASEITVTEMNKEKIELIKSFGIVDHVVASDAKDIDEQLQTISQGGYDIVFDCTGIASAIDTGIKALKQEFKKKFTAVGLPHAPVSINYERIVLKEVILRGSKGHQFHEFRTVARMVADKKLDVKKYITTRIKLSEVQAGFEGLKARRGADVKAVIEID